MSEKTKKILVHSLGETHTFIGCVVEDSGRVINIYSGSLSQRKCISQFNDWDWWREVEGVQMPRSK